MGVTGSGKSTTGNKILQEDKFLTLGSCSSSVTTDCQEGTVFRNGRQIQVVDTPGLFDTHLSPKELREKLILFIGMTCPGPHVIFYVIKAGRSTEEQTTALDILEEIFGSQVFDFTIFVFTHLSDISSPSSYLSSMDQDMKNRLGMCRNRYVFLPNPSDAIKMETNIQNLMNMAYELHSSNGEKYFTNKMFEKQQRIIEEQKRQEREERKREERHRLQGIRKGFERAGRKRIDNLAAKVEAARQADEQTQRELEEERRRQEQAQREAEMLKQEAIEANRKAEELARCRRKHRRRSDCVLS